MCTGSCTVLVTERLSGKCQLNDIGIEMNRWVRSRVILLREVDEGVHWSSKQPGSGFHSIYFHFVAEARSLNARLDSKSTLGVRQGVFGFVLLQTHFKALSCQPVVCNASVRLLAVLLCLFLVLWINLVDLENLIYHCLFPSVPRFHLAGLAVKQLKHNAGRNGHWPIVRYMGLWDWIWIRYGLWYG